MRGGKLFMKFGLEQMNEIIEKLIEEKLPYPDSVVVGDNSSGKSLLLRLFIEKMKDNDEVYFIDAVNRGFDVKKVSKTEKKPEYKKTILETRIKEVHFNLVDSFNCYGTLTERIEMIYELYEEELQTLFYKFTGDRFRIIYGSLLGEVDFGNGQGLLSSGYQALVRIFLELLYYQDMVIWKRNVKTSWIVIDEIDEFLSPKYSAGILEFLKEEFPWAKWLVTTHSCDLVAHTSDNNLIILDKSICEVLDINDYSSVSEVQIVFERLFGKQNLTEDEIESVLRRLFNNKINKAWGTYDEECLEKLKEKHLSASQQLIVRQIQEW